MLWKHREVVCFWSLVQQFVAVAAAYHFGPSWWHMIDSVIEKVIDDMHTSLPSRDALLFITEIHYRRSLSSSWRWPRLVSDHRAWWRSSTLPRRHHRVPLISMQTDAVPALHCGPQSQLRLIAWEVSYWYAASFVACYFLVSDLPFYVNSSSIHPQKSFFDLN